MRNLSEIAFFLHSGYLPTYNKENLFDRLLENNPLKLEKHPENIIYDENLAIEEGIKAFKSLFENIQGDLHIVPLSGGLDSRTILAELIERGLNKQIVTVTFGVPGSYDYEIGSMLSKKFGLRHEEIDLNTIHVSQDKLLETAINGSSWTFLIDAFYNSLIPKKFGKEATYWSGFPGGCLLGLSFPHGESASWKDAQDYFLDYGKLVYSINLIPPGFQLRDSLPETPILDPSILSYDDQLYFVIRQQNYMFRVLMFKGFNYKTPLFSPEWAKFSLRLPLQFRSGGYIFHKILRRLYAQWISLPNTKTFGGSLNISKPQIRVRRIMNGLRRRIDDNPRINMEFLNPIWRLLGIYRDLKYIDYNTALRERDDLKSMVLKNLQDLQARGILHWLDLDAIWSDHQNKRASHGVALLILNALEISLKADEA